MPRDAHRRRENSHGNKRKPQAQTAIETDQLRCPKNHKLPNKTNYGECTPLYCAAETAKPVGQLSRARQRSNKSLAVRAARGPADEELAKMPVPEAARPAAEEAQIDTLTRLSAAAGRASARKTFFKVPEGLQGADAETWAQQKAVSLLPDALVEIEYQLKMGDDAQRRDAARDVLDINGMRKRENANTGGATIILNLNGAEVPWAQKVVKKVVNGQKTEALPVLVGGASVDSSGSSK